MVVLTTEHTEYTKMKNSLLIVAVAGVVIGGCTAKTEEAGAPQIDARPLVRVGAVDSAHRFREVRRVQASLRTKESALVSARVSGTIDELFVEEGAKVEKGQKLFQVDRVNLENAVRVAEDDNRLAKAKAREASVTLEKANLDDTRMKRLVADGAVTKDTAEKASVAFARAKAVCDAAAAQITKSETALAIARKNLADSTAVAPFAGTVKRKMLDVGDYARTGAPVFAVDNPAVHEICFDLNAADYARVKTGETKVETSGRTLVVSYKSPSVNPATRTFEARATIDLTDDLAPGMLLDADVVLRDDKAPGLPVRAVNLRGGKSTVFVVAEGVVKSVEVKAGITDGGWREVHGVPDGAKVIVEGMLLVNEGDAVRVAGE